ncbi:hypothetical protein OFAG_02263 [Oxalobacter formigenes HOxBLS]|uniref:Uncharacterized protein n=1 Tax=Oxalobacter paraformigenes TaxID=556268 RepID=T5LPL4_9BURK|nr:hypothetical protein OFAG_02263 [Oxalobacter paraformigenes]
MKHEHIRSYFLKVLEPTFWNSTISPFGDRGRLEITNFCHLCCASQAIDDDVRVVVHIFKT